MLPKPWSRLLLGNPSSILTAQVEATVGLRAPNCLGQAGQGVIAGKDQPGLKPFLAVAMGLTKRADVFEPDEGGITGLAAATPELRWGADLIIVTALEVLNVGRAEVFLRKETPYTGCSSYRT